MIKVPFNLERETKGALRYQESDANGSPQKQSDPGTIIGTLYLRKNAFPDHKYPQRLLVTIE